MLLLRETALSTYLGLRRTFQWAGSLQRPCSCEINCCAIAVHLVSKRCSGELVVPTQVTSIVACMLETGSDAIVEHLFGDCDLLGWLLNAPAQFEPERRGGDERCSSLHQPTSCMAKMQHVLCCISEQEQAQGESANLLPIALPCRSLLLYCLAAASTLLGDNVSCEVQAW